MGYTDQSSTVNKIEGAYLSSLKYTNTFDDDYII